MPTSTGISNYKWLFKRHPNEVTAPDSLKNLVGRRTPYPELMFDLLMQNNALQYTLLRNEI